MERHDDRRRHSSRLASNVRTAEREQKKAAPRAFNRSQVARFKVPRVFSFLDDPETAISEILKMRELAENAAFRILEIDHSGCQNLGLCASTVMDVFLLRARGRRRSGNSLSFLGVYPRSPEVKMMLCASGLLRHLGLPESVLPPEQEALVKRCELYQGKANRIEKAKQRDRAATQLTDYFNGCLRSLDYSLSPRGRFMLSALMTEVIGNAEEHGGPWHTIGHWQMATAAGGASRSGECHIVIFNFGSTIYDSLKEDDTSESLKAKLRGLADLHKQRGWFGLTNPDWDEETLWTLYALQERVSRFSDTERGIDRGNGTINMIEFFDSLASGSRKMCVVSGHAYILFDGSYHLREVQRGSESLKVIAFNEDNDLERPPNKRYVYRLKNYFPGTLVSIRLKIDQDLLRNAAGGDEDGSTEN